MRMDFWARDVTGWRERMRSWGGRIWEASAQRKTCRIRNESGGAAAWWCGDDRGLGLGFCNPAAGSPVNYLTQIRLIMVWRGSRDTTTPPDLTSTERADINIAASGWQAPSRFRPDESSPLVYPYPYLYLNQYLNPLFFTRATKSFHLLAHYSVPNIISYRWRFTYLDMMKVFSFLFPWIVARWVFFDATSKALSFLSVQDDVTNSWSDWRRDLLVSST